LLIIADSISSRDVEEIIRLELNVVVIGRMNIEKSFIKKHISCEGKNAHQIYDELQEEGFVPHAVRTNSENYVLLKAEICKLTGIPFISPDVAKGVIEKHLMRERFIAAKPQISPQFSTINTHEQIDNFIDTFGLPVMLKPSALDRSMLVTRAETIPEAHAAYDEIKRRIDGIYSSRKNSLKPTIIIEQYMTGPKFSVEGIVDASGKLFTPNTITDLWFGYDIGVDDPMNHLRIVPSNQPQSVIDAMITCARDAVEALKLVSTPIHAELILVDGQAKIIEIACRIGGYRQGLYKAALGVSLFEQDLRMQISESIDMSDTKPREYAAAFKVYAESEGTLEYISNMELFDVPQCTGVKVKINPGVLVGPSKLGYSEILHALFQSNSYEDIQRITSEVTSKVKAVLSSKTIIK